ncbi:hypothetical protein MA4S0726RA_4023 [Mycobacteroides abscessus 4S-0726-RA]|nr:hypothetical protein MA4S0726RA_4023 [Mycobacteroides abscessus 4S-0726-RA]
MFEAVLAIQGEYRMGGRRGRLTSLVVPGIPLLQNVADEVRITSR